MMIAVVGLYLYDSALLLYCNEAMLIPKGKCNWSVVFGSENLRVVGKQLYIPNPFQMHRPLFRASWQYYGSPKYQEPWDPPRKSFMPLAPLVWNMAIALFLFLPLGLFTRLGDSILRAALVLLFSSILIALVWVWIHRAEFRIGTKRFAGLAFESLVCPPFALNLVRHVAMTVPVSEDLVSVARRLQNPDDWGRTREQLIRQLSDEMEHEDTESARYALLQKRRMALESEGTSCLS